MKKSEKSCAYCGRKFDKDQFKRTREHVIPDGIIKLFPQQYINTTNGKKFIDKSGSVVKDVCAFCNNGILSELDSYGNKLIEEYFINSIEENLLAEQNVNLNYNLLSRWLLKIIYNFCRQNKLSYSWFENAIEYITKDIRVLNIKLAVFAGIHINSSPMPEDFYGYKPMEILAEPKLLGNSLSIISYGIDPYINSVKLNARYADKKELQQRMNNVLNAVARLLS